MLVLYELKKQLETPFVYIVLALCAAANIFMLSSDSANRIIMQEAELVAEAGTQYMTAQVAQSITDEKRDIAYSYAERAVPPESAVQLMISISTGNAFGIDESFALNIAELSAPAFSKRLEEMRANSELNAVNGGSELFSKLSGYLWLSAMESMIFALLITSRICGHEAAAGTAAVVYSTRTGRRIRAVKAAASVIISVGFQAVLFPLCCAGFFVQCPCFVLLSAPAVVPEIPIQMFPWFSVSVGGHFALNYLLTLLLSAVFSLLGFCCCGKKGGILQLLVSLSLTLVMPLPAFIKPEICSPYLYCLTPTSLLMSRPGYWLTVSRNTLPVCGIELYAMMLWTALLLLGSAVGYRSFRKAKL